MCKWQQKVTEGDGCVVIWGRIMGWDHTNLIWMIVASVSWTNGIRFESDENVEGVKQNLEFSKEKLKTQIELSVRFSVIPGDPL